MKTCIIIMIIILNIGLLADDKKSTVPNSTDTKSDTTSKINATLDTATELFNKMIPIMKQIITEKVGPVTKKMFKDDKSMRKTFNAIYQFMPLPLRLAMTQKEFTDICIKNKNLLVEVVHDLEKK